MGEENTTSRQDQQRWAEFEPNTAPQVSIESGLETATLIEPDVAQVRPSVQANAGEGSIIQATQSSAPTGVLRKLGSRKVMLWVGLGILICIAIVVGVSVPLVGDKVNAANASTTSEGPTLVTNTGASPSITSSAATPSSQVSVGSLFGTIELLKGRIYSLVDCQAAARRISSPGLIGLVSETARDGILN